MKGELRKYFKGFNDSYLNIGDTNAASVFIKEKNYSQIFPKIKMLTVFLAQLK